MTFDELTDFISNRMRMSHVYQPVMLIRLLTNRGRATDKDIARAILSHDESQIEYYQRVTNEMVGQVLRRHRIVTKDRQLYTLSGYDQLSDDQVQALIALCQQKLDEYIARRGDRMWRHRTLAEGYISGTLRYEVLKRAKFHCELCGVSADEKALQVDHIIPRNRGGEDDLANLQALCYTCNAMKRDRDDTDFRQVIRSYGHREEGCLFCDMPSERVILENRLAIAILDKYPVTAGHVLVVPRRHIATYFELGRPEINACNLLLEGAKSRAETEDSKVNGFNIGINAGQTAGQTIFHCHIHLIPRRSGDVSNPAGGVRHLIPGRGHYGRD
jgi:diadenosine tetraphosphate (Ap4A) HIT family hydrolase/5-methylcytosine-specific restriction endonuclease McrA